MALLEKTVRDIALESPATIRVFEEFKIDYCCGGNKSLTDACAAANVSAEAVTESLSGILNNANVADSSDSPERKSAVELVDYILEKHHTYTKRELERLTPLMEKVCFKHGEHSPELFDLQKFFYQLKEDLLPHMQKEEMVLFPFIERLDAARKINAPIPIAPFGSVANPIRMMMSEHDTDGAILKEMRTISNGYVAPESACPSFKALYFGLEELEADLHKHIHLENNVLFPMAQELEPATV